MALFRVSPAGDLELSAPDPVTGKRTLFLVRREQYVRQKLACRFKFFLGEWFLDLREGIPYYRDVFIKNPDVEVIRSVFRKVVQTTPEVGAITRFEVVYDPAARELAFDFQVTLTTGEVLVISKSERAFIITLEGGAAA